MKKFILLYSVLLLHIPVLAQFSNDTLQNTVVQDLSGSEQSVPLSAGTSDGKTFISWFDISSGSYVLRMQLLDAGGNALWGQGGTVISNFPQSTALFRYDLKVDQDDNAIVAFQDERSGSLQVVAYKVNSAGNSVWGNGIVLTDSTADGIAPKITVTASNNVVIAFGVSLGAAKWIVMKKLDPAGNILWSKRIIDTNKYGRPSMVRTGADDFILHYVRETGNFPGVTSTMLAQRYNASGTAVWPQAVTFSSKTIPFFFFPELQSDLQGGGFLAFNTGNPLNLALNDVYAQHIDANGTVWSPTGTQLDNSSTINKLNGGFTCDTASSTYYFSLQVLDAGQGNSGISLQALNAGGAVQLGTTALSLQPISASYYLPYALVNSGSSLLFIYANGGFGTQKLYAMKTDFSGNQLWSWFPTVCNFSSNKDDVSAGNFVNNQAVIVWADDRLDLGIYAQNISGDGQFGVVTSVNTPAALSNIRVAPNPSEALSIVFDEKTLSPFDLRLTDAAGKEVFTCSLPAGTGNILLPATGQLPSGVYQVELRSTITREGRILRWMK